MINYIQCIQFIMLKDMVISVNVKGLPTRSFLKLRIVICTAKRRFCLQAILNDRNDFYSAAGSWRCSIEQVLYLAKYLENVCARVSF